MRTLIANEATLEHAAELLHEGRLVAFPTETVYGLGADASNPNAVAKIFAAKGRPADHPLIVHIAGADRLTDWADTIPEAAKLLAERFWPGPLAIVLNKKPHVPDAVTGGQPTVGLRVPGHPVALRLLEKFGGGIAAPSANRFCRISPTTARHVEEELGDNVDLILDGGSCSVGVESTIVDLSGAHPRLLRPGRITLNQLQAALGVEPIVAAKTEGADIRAPGMMAVHYAPVTQALLCAADQLEAAIETLAAAGQRVGVIASRPHLALELRGIRLKTMPKEPHAFEHALYAALREMDNLAFDLILIEQPPESDAWHAVNDRLRKATVPSEAAIGR